MVDILHPSQPYTQWKTFAEPRSSNPLHHAFNIASGPLNYAPFSGLSCASERSQAAKSNSSTSIRFDTSVPIRSRLRPANCPTKSSSFKASRVTQLRKSPESSPNARVATTCESTDSNIFRVPSLPCRTAGYISSHSKPTPTEYHLPEQTTVYPTCPSRPALSPASTVSSQSTQSDYESDANPNTSLDPVAILRHKRRSNLLPGQLPPSLRSQKDASDCFVKYLMYFATALLASIWPNSAYGRGISLFDFVSESLRRSKTSYSTLQVALFYLIMLKSKIPGDHLTQEQVDGLDKVPLQCGRRMFLSVLMLASKYLQDKNYSTTAWSKITGLSCTEINEHERMVLIALEYRLHIPKHIFGNWNDLVISLCQRTRLLPPLTRVTFGVFKEVPASWQFFIRGLEPEMFHDSTQIKSMTERVWQDAMSIPIYETPYTQPQSLGQPAMVADAIRYPPSPPESSPNSPYSESTLATHHSEGPRTLPHRALPFLAAPISRRPSKMDLSQMIEQVHSERDFDASKAEQPQSLTTWPISQDRASEAAKESRCEQATLMNNDLEPCKPHARFSLTSSRRRVRTPSPLAHEILQSSTNTGGDTFERTPVPDPDDNPPRSICSNTTDDREDSESVPSLHETASTHSTSQPRTPTTCVQAYIDPFNESVTTEKEKAAAEALLTLGLCNENASAVFSANLDDAFYSTESASEAEEHVRRATDFRPRHNVAMHVHVREELAGSTTPQVPDVVPDLLEPQPCQTHMIRFARKHSTKNGKKRPGAQHTETKKKRTKTDAPRSRHGKHRSVDERQYRSPPSSTISRCT